MNKEELHYRVYHSIVSSGLMAQIPGNQLKTLMTLATFMNENGVCFPTQDTLARALGVKRQTVTRHINDLLEFRFNGVPIIEKVNSRWHNTYRILPTSQIAIFDGQVEKLIPTMSQNCDQLCINSDTTPQQNCDIDSPKTVAVTTPKNNNQEQEIILPSEPTLKTVEKEEFKNVKDILTYFLKKYREKYSVNATPNYGRDQAIIKNKLMANYSMAQIKEIIDVAFAQYDTWGNLDKYPRVSLGALTTWLPNKVLEHLDREKKHENKIIEYAATPENGGLTDEQIMRYLEGGSASDD